MIITSNIVTNIEINSLEDLYKLKPFTENSSLNINKSQIARELNVDRRTVDKYINGFQKSQKRKKASRLDKYYDIIQELLSDENPQIFYYKRVLFQYLVDNHGLKECIYSNFCHYINSHEEFAAYFNHKKPSNAQKPVIRFETPAGKQAQLDWKENIPFILKSGETININILVLLLSYSRFRVYRLSLSKTQDVLFSLLNDALETFGGVPEEIVTDKCGGKKVAKDEEKPAKAKQVDEEGEEVEEVKEYDVEKLKDSKKAEKTEAEPEAEGEEDEAEEEVIEDKKAKKAEKPEEKKPEAKAKDEEVEEVDEEISVESKKALKDAGLENAADYVQKAFLSGCKDENIKLYEKARKEEKETKSIAQDEKLFTEDDITEAYNVAKQDLMAEIEAIEVCKPVLGNIKIGAYDSANDIYLEACKELNLTCDSANARDVYNAYQMSKKTISVKTGTTGNRGKTKDGIERIFDNVFSNV